ncbi:MAG: MarR family winged helix-turn-helix transcriptional regulator, partial [Acidimicrobiales bacterium]
YGCMEPTPSPAPGDAGRPPELSPARLRIAVARLARRLRPTAAAGWMTAAEVDMLVVADKRGPARMSDLASFCGLNPTMLSRMVPKLEQAGLLARRPDPADKRVCQVEATAKARKVLQQVRSERNDILSLLLRDLDGPEREAIAAATPALEKLAERLREGAPQAPERAERRRHASPRGGPGAPAPEAPPR